MAAPTASESQPQRTRFAWRRTSLALTTGSLLSIAVVVRRDGGAVAMAVLAAQLAIAAAGLTLAERRVRALDRPAAGRMGRSAALLALVVTAVGALGIALVVLTST